MIQPEKFGTGSSTLSLVHEVGHNLGLWHVHHGISEVLGCSDPCMETHPSLQLGDLCSDTTPTPENSICSNPSPAEFPCGIKAQKSRTFANYMGYGGKQYGEEINDLNLYMDKS